MPRFVVLRHEVPPNSQQSLHWDLMLERDGVLLTWALAEEPAPGKAISAVRLADHRLAYLDYEGPVSGDRGTVARWDAGEYVAASQGAAELRIVFGGEKLRGKWTLRQRDQAAGEWELYCCLADPDRPS
jgi:hypothetical protein